MRVQFWTGKIFGNKRIVARKSKFLKTQERKEAVKKYTDGLSASNELPVRVKKDSITDEVGCTACFTLIISPKFKDKDIKAKQIICANLGDSRCVLAKKDGEKVVALDLSIDHKPNNEEEK